MNPIFILLGLLGATAFSRSSSSSSDTTDPMTILGLSVEPDEENDEDDTNTAGAAVVGSTADSYDDIVAAPEEQDTPVEDSVDPEEDKSDDDDQVELDDQAEDDGQEDVPSGFEMIFDDLVVADDAEEPSEDEADQVVETPASDDEVDESDNEDEAEKQEPVQEDEDVIEEDPPVVEEETQPEEQTQPEEETQLEEETQPAEDTGSSQASAPAAPNGGSLELQGFSSAAFSENLDAPIAFQFNQDIQLGDGGVELRIYNADGYETVERISGDGLEISGNQLLVSPSGGLDPLRDYAINLEPGTVETLDGTPFGGLTNDTFSFTSGIGIEEPTIDFSQYDTIIDGATFNETLFLNAGDSNTLIINSTFENIDGSGIMLRDVENVTIANSTFRNIDDFGILLRSSGSSDGVTITGNSFEDVGGDAIHAAKRFVDDVDHTNLVVHDNDVHDVASKGFHFHGIYVQSSEAVVWGNEVTGSVGGNGISIRADGIVYDNYVDVTTGREFGSGIKYFSDHLTGDTKTLVIADNVVEGNNLHAGIQLDQTSSNQPGNISDEDWVVNDFFLLRNDVGGRSDYSIDSSLENASWATIEFIGDAPAGSASSAVAAFLPEMPVEDANIIDTDTDELEDALVF